MNMEYNDENIVTEVFCPLVDEIIEDIDCIENRDIIDGCFKMSCLPKKYKAKENFKEICKQCKLNRPPKVRPKI